MPTILLVRHAQASYGGPDYDVLSPLAGDQIAALAATLEARGIHDARTVSGPLRRQRETAALGRDGAGVRTDARLAEYDADAIFAAHGEAGMSLSGTAGAQQPSPRAFQQALDAALVGWVAAQAGFAAFRDGAVAALAELGAELGRGETALAFSSAGTIAAICASLLGADAAFVALNRVQVNTAITRVAVGASGLTLVSFNGYDHLDPALVTMR
jgi:broad specificity phosphatase PhoE